MSACASAFAYTPQISAQYRYGREPAAHLLFDVELELQLRDVVLELLIVRLQAATLRSLLSA